MLNGFLGCENHPILTLYEPEFYSHGSLQQRGPEKIPEGFRQRTSPCLAYRWRHLPSCCRPTSGVPLSCLEAEGTMADHRKSQGQPWSGRPRKTIARVDRFIVCQALTSRSITARCIRRWVRVATNINISNQTARKRLHQAQLHSGIPDKRPKHTAAHKRTRRAFSPQHSRWTRVQWAGVLFSDESRFPLSHSDKGR